jgi:dipeptidyl aminopeptidase/acylaminoacyl peptidase
MRKAIFASALAALLLMAACGGEEPKAEVPTYTIEQFLKTTSIFGNSFSPDETKLLVTSNETGVFNVYYIDLATLEHAPVTEGEETTFAVSYFPDDERILFTRDKGGNEINHLYMRDAEGNDVELTKLEQAKEQFFGWSYDLKSFFTGNNGRDMRFFDIYEWDIETLEPKLFWQNDVGYFPTGISNDKRWLVLGQPITDTDSNLFLVDLQAGGAPKLISEHEGSASFDFADFSADSKYLYYTTTVDGEWATLKRYNVETGEHEAVYAPEKWDVSYAYFSRNGTYRVIGTNEDGYIKIQILNTTTGEPVALPELPGGTITGIFFSRSEKLMLLNVGGDRMPSNIFLYNIETGETKQLTDNLNPEINPDYLVAGEVVRFAARDGLEVPGILYKPLAASAENKVPALLWVHGGPGGQSIPRYSAEMQFLINHGYALYAINNRGSSGYGKSFLAADDLKHGREPLWDCVDAKGLLKSYDWIDPDKIGIMGGSYGGYMTLAALTLTPDEFAVGVDLFGISNWVRTLKSIPPWWEAQREALYKEIGNPETDEEMLLAISPLFHADKVTKPLMILQGANDPRVIKAESDDMVKAIQDRGGIVEYVLFEDEGHGFTKNENRIEGYNKVLAFLDKYLKGVPEETKTEEKPAETTN